MKKIKLTGRVRNENIFLPDNSILIIEGFIDIKNLTVTVENYFERWARKETLVDATKAKGIIDGINIKDNEGDFERWQLSINNPFLTKGQYSKMLDKELEYSSS